ncbi:MAG: sensor histidine kinase [Solirubrobacteraceae bacterium]
MLRSITPSRWLRLPTRTARLRLTLFYAGLFLLLGTVLLAIVYLLASRGGAISVATPSPVIHRKLTLPGGGVVTLPAAPSTLGQNIVVQQHNADLARLVTISWIVLLVTTAGAAVLGWFAAGRVLRPVREITATARTISAGNLHERLARTGRNDEFKQLGDTLDDLFGRLEASFEAQRRFVANASHELRTPLTLERTLLQVALADPNASELTLRATCEELLASQVDQERLLEGLLTLASSERGLELREPVDLPALVDSALRQLAPKLERRGLSIEATLGPATAMGDPALIGRLIVNLLDNAIDHNVDRGHVDVGTQTLEGHAVLTISNTGAPIPASETGRLFEPFQQLHGSRLANNGHHGLGLSIVRAIAVAHDAELDAKPRPAGGLTVTVRFRAQNGSV